MPYLACPRRMPCFRYASNMPIHLPQTYQLFRETPILLGLTRKCAVTRLYVIYDVIPIENKGYSQKLIMSATRR